MTKLGGWNRRSSLGGKKSTKNPPKEAGNTYVALLEG